MKTTTKINNFEIRKAFKTGREYFIFHTSMGEMSAFESKIIDELKAYAGTDAAVEIEYSDTNGFKNIKAILGKAKPGAAVESNGATAIAEARASKDTSIYTSYAKDIFLALYTGEKILEEKREDNVKGMSIVTNFELMRRATELVKQARDVFK